MKPHYSQSRERLIEGTDIVAACGALVPKATWAFMLDRESKVIDALTLVGNSLTECRTCLAIIDDSANKIDGPRYIYAMLPGEEALHAEVA